MSQDHYRTLGVSEDASGADIRAAYRRLALQWHPDRVEPTLKKEAEERFKYISEAYSVLSDPSKRRHHDLTRHPGPGQDPRGFYTSPSRNYSYRTYVPTTNTTTTVHVRTNVSADDISTMQSFKSFLHQMGMDKEEMDIEKILKKWFDFQDKRGTHT